MNEDDVEFGKTGAAVAGGYMLVNAIFIAMIIIFAVGVALAAL